jgi:hypothetical protein
VDGNTWLDNIHRNGVLSFYGFEAHFDLHANLLNVFLLIAIVLYVVTPLSGCENTTFKYICGKFTKFVKETKLL